MQKLTKHIVIEEVLKLISRLEIKYRQPIPFNFTLTDIKLNNENKKRPRRRLRGNNRRRSGMGRKNNRRRSNNR